MGQIDEALFAKTPLGSDLAAGVESLDLDQEITFTRYIRLVLPLDGFVFWVRAAIMSPSALIGALLPNRVMPNQPPANLLKTAVTFCCKGSLHYATELRQEAQEVYAAHRVVFTAEQPVNDLAAIAPNEMWIGEFQGKRFGFSARGAFYEQADLHHYVGFAIYPDMETQIIDSPAGFNSHALVVSNSLPAWLALNSYFPQIGFTNPGLTLYPSFLIPQNLPPPYGAVDIPPESTHALASAPTINSTTSSHTQLCSETVRITLWGLRNDPAMDFMDAVYQYSANRNVIGIMNTPVPRDEKRTQTELGVIAIKKTIEFEVSYLQSRIRTIAKQTIKSCIPNIYIDGVPA